MSAGQRRDVRRKRALGAITAAMQHECWQDRSTVHSYSSALRAELVDASSSSSSLEVECKRLFGYDSTEQKNEPARARAKEQVCQSLYGGLCVKDVFCAAASRGAANLIDILRRRACLAKVP